MVAKIASPAHLVREGTFSPAATRKPEKYRGVALKVVRDDAGAPVVVFDGNGIIVWMRRSLTYDVVDVPWNGEYSPGAVTQAVNGGAS